MTCAVRSVSACGRAESVIKNKNGISLATNPAISAIPQGSWIIAISGGRSHPANCATSLTIQPDGAIRNASPKAAVACGTDRIGDKTRCMARNMRVPCQAAQKSMTIATEIAVAIKPLTNDSRIDAPRPGCANSACHGSRDGVVPPSAGNIPNAGKTVPISPAETGPIIRTIVRIGTKRNMRYYCTTP